MLYMVSSLPEYVINKHTAVYDADISPDPFLFKKGIKLNPEEVSRCYCYMRSSTLNLPDDPFIRYELRRKNQRAYIFTPNELFYFAGGSSKKIKIDADSLNKLKVALSLTSEDTDKPPRVLSDQQLEIISVIKGCPKFSRVPILHLNVTKAEIAKYDCLPNSPLLPLVNQKIVEILIKLAPDDVQFFDTEVHCKDSVLTNYKLLNIIREIEGIDYEKSIYSGIPMPDGGVIHDFKYLIYKPECMGNYKLARDKDYHSHLLATEEIKQTFEETKIKGMCFVRPEEFFRPLKPEDLID